MTSIKSYFTLLLFVFSSTLMNAQTNEIDLATISSKWNSGKYQLFWVYEDNGGLTMRGGKIDVDITKDKEGLISQIKYKIQNSTYEFEPIFWGGNGGPLIGFKHGRNQYLYIAEDGMAHYTMMGSKMDGLNFMIGTKLGGSKKVKKMIMEYRGGLESIAKQRDEDRKNALAEHRNKFSIKDKNVKEIKVKLKSDDAKIDCSSKFIIEYTAILNDGTTIKSKSQGGEAYSSDYKFRVLGADGKSLKDKEGKNLGYSEYTVHKYCDKMDDKHLLVEVASKYNPDLYGTVRIATSCVPDPAVIAQKKRDEERRKEQELMAAKRAEQEKEEQRLLAEQKKKAAARAKTLASSLSNGKVVGNGDGIGLLIFETNVKADNSNPAKLTSKNFKQINGKIYGFGSNGERPAVNTYHNGKVKSKPVKYDGSNRSNMIDGDLDQAGNVYYVSLDDVFFAKNAGANFVAGKSISSEKLFDKPGVDLCAIASIGENKCIVFGYSWDKNHNYVEGRRYDANNRKMHHDNLYIAIWDHVTGKKMVREYIKDHAYGTPKVIKSYDGNVIVAYSRFSRYLWKLDALASFKSGELKTIWKKELPRIDSRIVSSSSGYAVDPVHMFEDKDKNIVITYIDDYKIMCFQKVAGDYNNYENNYCSLTGIGRIDKNGALYQESFFTGYNLSKWGGSHEYSLKNVLYPGQILMNKNNIPIATQHPITGDYIMINTGEGTQIDYPLDFTRLPRKDFYGGTVAWGHSSEPNVVIINGLDMSLQTFDLVETEVKLPNGEKARSGGTAMVEYDKVKKDIILYDNDSKLTYRVKPSFLLQWAPGPNQDITQRSSNYLDKAVVASSSSTSGSKRPKSSSSSKPQVESGKWIVKNESGSTQFIGINGQSKELRNGDEWKLSCVSDLYYYYKEGTSNKRGKLIVEGDDVCGTIYKLK